MSLDMPLVVAVIGLAPFVILCAVAYLLDGRKDGGDRLPGCGYIPIRGGEINLGPLKQRPAVKPAPRRP